MIVQLSWAASADTTVQWYNVYRGIQTGGPYIKIARNIKALSFRDMPDYGDWVYVITAENFCSEGIYSPEVAVTAPTSPDASVSVIANLGSCGVSDIPDISGGGGGFGAGGYGL